MVFTDDDLKRLKADIEISLHEENYLDTGVDNIQALVVRLEAAEEFGDNATLAFPSLRFGDDYRTWRKAAGK